MAVAPRTPQDHQVPKAPRVRKSTAEEMTVADQVIAEVDAEPEIAADGHLVALLCGEEIRVLPDGQWRQSTNAHLMAGRFNDWAKTALAPESYDLWMELDPMNVDVIAFFEDYGRRSGSRLGDTTRSAPSARSIRKN